MPTMSVRERERGKARVAEARRALRGENEPGPEPAEVGRLPYRDDDE